ncbi:hypothetical protein M8312_13260 [Sphingomonas sp. KRR8]|uniref:hypothetical protein n=1 Tax=Sphingomonas sp. KRR8 TaxID=2942996 RepID=UPI002021E6B6|nr:hypothetical protein [Sphingomonas sp. KRR8]URD60727.1 hypothetical protein M8312_13260 [Sphingomonas sp. KRR8]
MIRHQLKVGQTWDEWRYMWKGPHGEEVRYKSRIGAIGVGTFTIGELVDPNSDLPCHTSKKAVSYAPSREELIIGVPGDGYEFSVR